MTCTFEYMGKQRNKTKKRDKTKENRQTKNFRNLNGEFQQISRLISQTADMCCLCGKYAQSMAFFASHDFNNNIET